MSSTPEIQSGFFPEFPSIDLSPVGHGTPAAQSRKRSKTSTSPPCKEKLKLSSKILLSPPNTTTLTVLSRSLQPQTKTSTNWSQSKTFTAQSQPETSTTQSQPKTSTTQSQPDSSATQSQPKTSTIGSQPKTSATPSPSKTFTLQSQPNTFTTQSQPKTSTIRSQLKISTAQSQPKTSTTQSQPKTFTICSQPKTFVTQSQFKISTTQPQPKTFHIQSQHTTSTSQSQSKTSTAQSQPKKTSTIQSQLKTTAAQSHLKKSQSQKSLSRLARSRIFNKRQGMISAESVAESKAATINVETYSRNKFTFHYWLPDLKLTTEDKEILLNPVGKLTDNIINAAQTLLRAQYPHVPGMQDVVCGMALSFDVQPEEFVQILNTQTEHWLTVSSIGCQHPTVNVYDSMFRSAGTKTKAQIACILHTQQKQIKLNFMSVHIQSGGSDCGLFAIANATALCCGENPGKYMYEQQLMREHLCKCFESRKMIFFPFKKYRRPQYHASVLSL